MQNLPAPIYAPGEYNPMNKTQEEYDPQFNWRIEDVIPTFAAKPEEYDPEFNWKIEGMIPTYIAVQPESSDYNWISKLYKAVEASTSPPPLKVRAGEQPDKELKEKIKKQVFEARNKISNTSVHYIMPKLKIRKNPKTISHVHEILRQLQLEDLRVQYYEYSNYQPKVIFIKSIKEYLKSKDIYNLSPDWLVKMCKLPDTRENILSAMKSIDSFISIKASKST